MPSARLVDSLATHAEGQPERVALVCGDRMVTYQHLYDLALAAGRQIRGLNLRPGSVVCIPAHKTPETIALLVAAFRAELIALTPSSDLGSEASARLMTQAGATCTLSISRDGVLSVQAANETETGAPRLPAPDVEDTRLLLTTSGSTGTPKIVPIASAGFDAFTDWAVSHLELTEADVALSYAPLNFDLTLLDIWTFLTLGARVIIVDQDHSTSAEYLQRLTREQWVTFIQGVPLLYRLLTQDGCTFEAPRQVISTGESLPAGLLSPIGTAFPNARFHSVFGCTETNDSFSHEVDPGSAATPLPIGRPLPGVSALLIDDTGAVVHGPGTGELLVTTPFQTSGYLDPEQNTRSFADIDGQRYFRTGDLVTRDGNGVFTLRGRADWQVKVRGVRTDLHEVETVIAEHPAVVEAVVVPLPDEQAGVRLHAHVTRQPGSMVTGLRLRADIGRRLPRHALPSSVHITEDPLPRTSTGKPDRNLIRSNRMKEIHTV